MYILECADGTYYVGQTRDLERRFWQHQSGAKPDAYTAHRLPVELVWYEITYSRDEAIDLERKLKGWSAKKKRAVIEDRWEDLPLLAKCNNATSHENYNPEEE